MFHNPEDVRWFKVRESICINNIYVCVRAHVCVETLSTFIMNHDWVFYVTCFLRGCWTLQPVEVWTKCDRRGRIKEPIGTHGMVLVPS